MLVVVVVVVVEVVLFLLMRKYKPIANAARAQMLTRAPKPIANIFEHFNGAGFLLTRSIEP